MAKHKKSSNSVTTSTVGVAPVSASLGMPSQAYRESKKR